MPPGFGIGSILIIIVIITLISLLVLFCYRKYINRKLHISIDEKIQTQTIYSLGQYQVFQDQQVPKKDKGDKSSDIHQTSVISTLS